MEDYFQSLPAEVLSLDNSIRFCAISNKLGYIISSKYRKDLQPLMTVEETEKYALLTTIRQATRAMWEEKIGKTVYSTTYYEKLIRITMPLIDSHLLLMSMDVQTDNFHEIMMKKVVPLVKKYSLAVI